MRRNRGLTLVEVLVIVLVVVVVAGLLLPSHGKVGESAQKINCLSNLKQIGLGLKIYTAETDWGVMPRLADYTAYSVPDARAAELGCFYAEGNGLVSDAKIFACPSANVLHGGLTVTGNIDSDAETSYSYFDSRISEMYADGDVNGTEFRGAANLIIAADEPAEDAAGRSLDQGNWNHPKGQQLLYADAHAKWSRETNPDNDVDSGSIYAVSGAPQTDTRIE